jgi:hypothetical protein
VKANAISILMYGHDERLLETRQWVLQSRGYRILTITRLAGFTSIPRIPPIKLVLLCHSLSVEEAEAAMALGDSRWPGVHILALGAKMLSAPSGLLGQLLHTMDGPAKLVSMVDELVGCDSSSFELAPS